MYVHESGEETWKGKLKHRVKCIGVSTAEHFQRIIKTVPESGFYSDISQELQGIVTDAYVLRGRSYFNNLNHFFL